MQVAKLVLLILNGHSFTINYVPREWLRHLIECAIQIEFVAIQVRELFLVPKQSLLQRNVNVHVQVVLHALKHVVRLLLEHNNNITLQHVRYLLALSLVDNLLIVSHALVDIDHEGLWFENNLLAPTSRAVFLISAALAPALTARLLHLHLHEAHVLHNLFLAATFALRASLSLATLSTTALAFGAVDIPAHGHFLVCAIVELFQSDLKFHFILWSLHAIVTAALVTLNLILTLRVVDLTLNIICEHFKRSVDLCELLCSLLIT